MQNVGARAMEQAEVAERGRRTYLPCKYCDATARERRATSEAKRNDTCEPKDYAERG